MGKKNRVLLVMTASMILGYMPWYNFSAVLKYLADWRGGSARAGRILRRQKQASLMAGGKK